MNLSLSDLEVLLPAPTTDPELAGRWGVVTQLSPLRVKLDGDAEALPITPTSLVYGLTVNARVWCIVAGRQLIIVGAYNGIAFPTIPIADKVTRVALGTSNLDLTNDSWHVVPWVTEVFDDANAWVSSEPTVVTTPTGYTRACCTFYTAWTSSTTAVGRFTKIEKNSVLVVMSNRNQLFESAEHITTGWIPTVAGDTFRALANDHNSGANLLGSSTYGGPCWFEVRFR